MTAVSAREAEVLAGIGDHLTNAEIAARLGISVRTVETHVSSLLRKAGAEDRRALAGLAGPVVAAAGLAGPAAAPRRPSTLPAALTPLVGRVAEQAALTAAIGASRLVTAVGPGGTGKTRLALAAASSLTGAVYGDLAPITDEAMVVPVVAAAVGCAPVLETVLARLGGREAVLVLDNCEHLVEPVVALIERVLTTCPRVRVLAVSRRRLLLPYETVFAVPGMTSGDAAELFRARVEASGGAGMIEDWTRVAGICRRLDGMPLAIELAAARLPALGLDGLEAGLTDRLRLLTGGPRADRRHRSLRSTLDWSHALLTEGQRVVLRRVSVFASPFTARDAADLLAGEWAAGAAEVAAALAALTEQSLLSAVPGPAGTRYRVQETIRQYGAERLAEAGEAAEAQARHLRWCLELADAIGATPQEAGWAARYDGAADELRAAQAWAAGSAERFRLAVRLAELSFVRGLPGETQRQYEQAAALTTDDREAVRVLRGAAEAAKVRHDGVAAMRLHRAAADAALRAGNRPRAAYELAQSAEMVNRSSGFLPGPVPAGEVDRLIAEAEGLAGDDPAARARVLVARACTRSLPDPAVPGLLERAIVLSREAGDPLAESAALDQMTSVHLVDHRLRDAARSVLDRLELLDAGPGGPELSDAYFMATDTAIATGDLAAGRRLAERIRDLPFHREEGHVATDRLLVVTALAGDWAETAALGRRFLAGWERAGRPRAAALARGPYAAAAVCGLLGDDEGRAGWLRVAAELTGPDYRCVTQVAAFFEALLLLHRGRARRAVAVLAVPPEQLRSWSDALWMPWYAAVWAEAAVLAGLPEADERTGRAMAATVDNPIARAMVERAVALAAGDHGGLLAAAERLRASGCGLTLAHAQRVVA
ncbi:ATP-binding protein [Actinoplanes sp. CA-142083]|uniref:ATP-binding protein n=1 Tax=Actinoplanes sp. CA-142083 TaxID=3239903 RepID=UPI003D8A140E